MAATKNRTAGDAELATAIATREKWETALATARAEAAAISEAVPEDTSDLDRIGQQTAAAHGRAEAAARALARAQADEAGARRDLLHRIADDAASERAPLERQAKALGRKIAVLLRSVRELDGVDYGPAPTVRYEDDGTTAPLHLADPKRSYSYPRSRTVVLVGQIRVLGVREAVLRYVADHGEVPRNARALLGTAPFGDEAALAQAGLAGVGGFEAPVVPDEAREYLAWLHPEPPAAVVEDDEEPWKPLYDGIGAADEGGEDDDWPELAALVDDEATA